MRTTPAHPAVVALADRHYPRRPASRGKQVAPPGRKIVLVTPRGDAAWVTLEQKRTKHAWPGAWCCSLFRNESRRLSSELIVDAMTATVTRWGFFPPNGLITFVDAEATAERRSRRAPPGVCFRWAGFYQLGTTKGGHGRRPKGRSSAVGVRAAVARERSPRAYTMTRRVSLSGRNSRVAGSNTPPATVIDRSGGARRG